MPHLQPRSLDLLGGLRLVGLCPARPCRNPSTRDIGENLASNEICQCVHARVREELDFIGGCGKLYASTVNHFAVRRLTFASEMTQLTRRLQKS